MTRGTQGKDTVSGSDSPGLKLRLPRTSSQKARRMKKGGGDLDQGVEFAFGARQGKDAHDQVEHKGIQTSLEAPEFGGPIGTGFLILWSHYSELVFQWKLVVGVDIICNFQFAFPVISNLKLRNHKITTKFSRTSTTASKPTMANS